MNILYLCTYYHRAMIFRDSMNKLEERGNKVIAFNAVAKGAVVDEKYKKIIDNKVFHEECFFVVDRYFYFLKQKKIEKRIYKKTDLKEFELLHSHTMFNGGWVARNIYKKKKIPYVVTVRNTDLNDFLKFPFFIPIAKIIARDAAGIMFLSESYKQAFLTRCYRNSLLNRSDIEKKCVVIPNGLEQFWLDNKYVAKTLEGDSIKLLCVGKIDKNKNMITVLDTIKVLQDRGIKATLTVIGQVVDKNILNQLETNTNVSIVPYLTKEELINQYRSHDIFVMPSFTESFGRVYAEAMTQGVPVIYTRKQGFDGYFPEGTVGYSVDPNNPIEIADSVEKITHDYFDISSRCISESNRFNWSDITVSLEKFYKEAVSD